MTIDPEVFDKKYYVDDKWFEELTNYKTKTLKEETQEILDVDYDSMTEKQYKEYMDNEYLNTVLGNDFDGYKRLRKDVPQEIKTKFIAFRKLLAGDKDDYYDGVQSMYTTD